jgi:ferric iron reductase protein FhuF
MSTALAEAVTAASSRFAAAYPLHLQAPAGEEVIPVERALSPECIEQTLRRAVGVWSDNPEQENLRAAASNFIRRYSGSIVAASLIPLANGVAVDVSPRRLSLVVRDGEPRGAVLDLEGAECYTSAERPTAWPVRRRKLGTEKELVQLAVRSLIVDNLRPTISLVRGYALLASAVMWTSVAEQIHLLYEGARDAYGEHEFTALAKHRDAVLDAGSLPGVDGVNPLLDRLTFERVVPEFVRPTHVRRVCCTVFLISGRGRNCGVCPRIAPEERREILRQRAELLSS